MPLTEQGKIMCAQQMRESEQDFLERFGSEELQRKLDRIGLYAYEFSDNELRMEATLDVYARLCEDIKYGNDPNLSKRYSQDLTGFRGERFRMEFYPPHVLAISKPFPDIEFRSRLEIANMPYQVVPVYRISELTEDEIRYRLGGGVWRYNREYIDLSRSVTRWRQK